MCPVYCGKAPQLFRFNLFVKRSKNGMRKNFVFLVHLGLPLPSRKSLRFSTQPPIETKSQPSGNTHVLQVTIRKYKFLITLWIHVITVQSRSDANWCKREWSVWCAWVCALGRCKLILVVVVKWDLCGYRKFSPPRLHCTVRGKWMRMEHSRFS